MSIWLPTVNGPRDLPDLRHWLLEHWKPGTALADVFRDAPWVRRTLQEAALWWVEPDTCEILAASAPTIPTDNMLNLADLPTPSGFAVFANDLEGIDADPTWDVLDGKVRVSGIMWGPLNMRLGTDIYQGMAIGSFSRSMFRDHRFSRAEMVRAYPTIAALAGVADKDEYARILAGGEVDDFDYPATGDVFSYLGRSDWLLDTGPDALLPGDDCPPETLRSKAEDRRLLAALWALTRSTVAEVSEAHVPRPVARRSERRGLDPKVRVLRLGGERTHHPGTGVSTREWQHQWVVSPHFRWQAHGPGRSERKLILVRAYRKGDPNMPLLGADRVWRVVPPKRQPG